MKRVFWNLDFTNSLRRKTQAPGKAELGFSVSVFFSILGWETKIPEDPCYIYSVPEDFQPMMFLENPQDF